MYWLYRSRHAISWLSLPVVVASLMVIAQPKTLKMQPHYDETVMALSLAESMPADPPVAEAAPSEPESPAEDVTPPEPEIPQQDAPPIEKPVVAPKPVVKPQVVKPVKKTRAKPVAAPQKNATDIARQSERSSSASSASPAPVSVPAAAPVRPGVNVQALENSYIQALRAQIEQSKRYPSGRQASLERPEGNVEIWLEVDRSGHVVNAGISQKAVSMLLNRAAASTLQSITRLKPFPADAFAGQNSKRFLATFHYQAQ